MKFFEHFKPKNILEHFKTLTVTQIVICVLEFVLFILMLVMDINFFVNIGTGKHFFGESLQVYEVVVSVFLLILLILVFMQFIFDLFIKDCAKAKNDTTQKIVKNGRVITINKNDSDNKD